MPRPLCQRCHRPTPVCFCHTLTTVNNQWPVYILQHPKESKHAIGTAIIAQLSLQHCRSLIVGNSDDEKILAAVIAEQQPLLVYPTTDSIPLDDIVKQTSTIVPTDMPRPLIFIDGTWRKSKRILLESPQLQSLAKISFTPTQAGRYQIRKAPNPNALSTVEAIVTVLSKLEKEADKYQSLLATMDWTIQQQIEKMGRETFNRNYIDNALKE